MSLTSQGLVHWWTWKWDLNECLKCAYLKIVARFETHTTTEISWSFIFFVLISHDIVNCQHEAIMLDLSWPRHCCHSMSRWYWEVTCSNPARRGCCQQICPYGTQDLWHVDIRPWSNRIGYTPNKIKQLMPLPDVGKPQNGRGWQQNLKCTVWKFKIMTFLGMGSIYSLWWFGVPLFWLTPNSSSNKWTQWPGEPWTKQSHVKCPPVISIVMETRSLPPSNQNNPKYTYPSDPNLEWLLVLSWYIHPWGVARIYYNSRFHPSSRMCSSPPKRVEPWLNPLASRLLAFKRGT